MARLLASLYPLVRYWAPEAVWPKMNKLTGKLDVSVYPDLSSVRVAIVNASEILHTTKLTVGERWSSVVDRMIVSLTSLLCTSDLQTLVLCFDSAVAPASRKIHPLLSSEMPDRDSAPGDMCQKRSPGEFVEPLQHMSYVLMDETACSVLYAMLYERMRTAFVVKHGGCLILDGLAPNDLIVWGAGPKKLIRKPVQGPCDAIDRIAFWTALHCGSDCVVQCYNAHALLKLLVQAELADANEGNIWFLHKRVAGRFDVQIGDIQSNRYVTSEPHEYINVRLATRTLVKVFAPAFSSLVVRTNGVEPLIMSVVALILLGFFDLYVADLHVPRAQSGMGALSIAYNIRSYLPGLVSAEILQHGEGAFSRVAVKIANDKFNHLFVHLVTPHQAKLGNGVAAVLDSVMNNLYNAHLSDTIAPK